MLFQQILKEEAAQSLPHANYKNISPPDSLCRYTKITYTFLLVGVGRYGHSSTVKRRLGLKKKKKKREKKTKNATKKSRYIFWKPKNVLMLWTFFMVKTESFEKEEK